MSKYKFIKRRVKFSDCGLDIDYNILNAVKCECGCGNYMNIVLEGNQEVADFIYTMLSDQECEYCALFALMQDNSLIFGSRCGDRMEVMKISRKDDGLNIDVVNDIQKDFKFHCYGLIEQVDETSYRIVME